MAIRIAIVGSGYVGLSLSCLLAVKNEVFVVDVDGSRVDMINKGVSPIRDLEIEQRLLAGELHLHATTSLSEACSGAGYIIISTPTDFVDEKGHFDTSTIGMTLDALDGLDIGGCVIIKSTVPIGYTERMALAHPDIRILFSPEFLREGHALYDNLHPSRVIVGIPKLYGDAEVLAEGFSSLLVESAEEDSDSIPTLIMGSSEAESVKLFSNALLAMRVAFFNEVDTFAEMRGLNPAEIINGVCLDRRIGLFYNNPSFGYGGYCLPKDSKQLLANYDDVPQDLIGAVVRANRTRKSFIASRIEELAWELHGDSPGNPIVGIYRLVMKSGSDNFRSSSVLDVMHRLLDRKIDVVIYEPLYEGPICFGETVLTDLDEFKRVSTLIVANRFEEPLSGVEDKVYTRDIFNRD